VGGNNQTVKQKTIQMSRFFIVAILVTLLVVSGYAWPFGSPAAAAPPPAPPSAEVIHEHVEPVAVAGAPKPQPSSEPAFTSAEIVKDVLIELDLGAEVVNDKGLVRFVFPDQMSQNDISNAFVSVYNRSLTALVYVLASH
jgi:hypothetical protein